MTASRPLIFVLLNFLNVLHIFVEISSAKRFGGSISTGWSFVASDAAANAVLLWHQSIRSFSAAVTVAFVESSPWIPNDR
jgi:hypothetical protein